MPLKLKQVRIFEGHDDHVSCCALSDGGEWAVSGSWDSSLRKWDTASGKCTAVLEGHTKQVFATTVAPSGDWLLSGGEDGTVRRWDAAKGEQLASTTTSRHAPTASEAQSLTTSFKAKKASDNQIYSTAIVGDGSSYVCGCSDYSIKHFSVGRAADSDELVASMLCHASAVHAVAPFADGTRVVSGSGDRSLCILDLSQHCVTQTLEAAHSAAIACCAPTDDSTVVSGGWDHMARIFDLRAGKEVAAMEVASKESCVTSIAALKNGTSAVFGCTCADGSTDFGLSIWDLRKHSHEFGHSVGIGATSLAVSADGQMLVTGCRDQTLRSWKMLSSSGICALQ